MTLIWHSTTFTLDTTDPDVIEAAKEADVDLSDPDAIADWVRNEDVENAGVEVELPEIAEVDLKIAP